MAFSLRASAPEHLHPPRNGYVPATHPPPYPPPPSFQRKTNPNHPSLACWFPPLCCVCVICALTRTTSATKLKPAPLTTLHLRNPCPARLRLVPRRRRCRRRDGCGTACAHCYRAVACRQLGLLGTCAEANFTTPSKLSGAERAGQLATRRYSDRHPVTPDPALHP